MIACFLAWTPLTNMRTNTEFFLHHEGTLTAWQFPTKVHSHIPFLLITEEFHSTPETQTDDSYNHPEDIEHFGHHEGIEREEAEREAKFAGVSVEEILAAQRAAEEEAAKRTAAQQDINNQQNLNAVDPNAPPARSPVIRVTPPEKQDPSVKYAGEKPHGEEWGTGDQGYKSPRDASDKMRKNLPYKV